MPAAAQPQAFFLPRPQGQRLCIHHPAQAAAPRAAVVYVHPLLEEMNKSRRMAALQSRRLAQAGCSVLQIDLLGCGDSSGDFADATWEAWIDDVLAAAGWLAQRTAAPLWLWGLRAGGLLAAAAAARMSRPVNLLLWQPVVRGQVALQQLLRLKSAAQLLEGSGKSAIQQLRQALAEGSAVDIAGYALSPALAQALEQARLAPSANVERLEWIELSSGGVEGSAAQAELAPASRQALAAWEAGTCQVRSQVVPGTAFWQTVEIAEAPALLDSTLAAIAAQPAMAAAS